MLSKKESRYLKIFILLIIAISLVGLNAQNSVASTDNFLAAKINPAALSFGNASGIAFTNNLSTDEKFENMSFIFNTDNLSYYLQYFAVDEINGEDIYLHKISISHKILKNIYSGTAYSWSNKEFTDGDFQKSLLYRPFDFLSFGAVVDNVLHSDRSFNLGFSARPLFFNDYIKNRVSFNADITYQDKWDDPQFGIQTELFSGIHLGGYTKLDTDIIGLNFSIDLANFKIGSLHFTDGDNDETSAFVNISDKTFRNLIIRPKKDKLYDFNLKGKIIEKKPSMQIGPFKIVRGKAKTVQGIIKELKKLKEDDRIGGIVIKSGNFTTSFANFIELKEAFTDFKSSGKKIIFYYDYIGNANYAFAANLADEIYLNPLGSINLKGISATMPYVKDLLDSLGIEVVNFRSHPYKTAGNMFSEKEMTPAERESYEYLLDGLHDELVKMIEEGRSDKLSKPVQTIIDEGPYFIAKDALKAGLVDKIIYEDELNDIIKEKFGKSSKIIKNKPVEYVRYDWSDEPQDKIALIYAIGNIHMGKGKSGKSIGSRTTAEAIRKARKDKSVKGIILRVDSGGGSALASDIIAREVSLCNKGENTKPVIVSMAGVAASGGYYISAFADKIIAQPTTITGSIGVIGMIPNFKGLYEKIGVNWSNVKTAEHADMYATHRKMTEEEKELIAASIDDIYWTFVGVVANGRKLDKNAVHDIAKGRVWTGKQAYERGLVDELGGLDKAVSEMKEIASLKHEVELVEYEVSRKGIDISLIGGVKQSVINELPSEIKTLYDLYEEMKMYGDEKILLILPHKISFQQ